MVMGDTEVTVASKGSEADPSPSSVTESYSTDSRMSEQRSIVGSTCNGHKQKILFTSENGLVCC